LRTRQRPRTGMSGQELWRFWRDQFDDDLAALAGAIWAANKMVKTEPHEARTGSTPSKTSSSSGTPQAGGGFETSRPRLGIGASTARSGPSTAIGSLSVRGSTGSTATSSPWRSSRASPRRGRRPPAPPSTSGRGFLSLTANFTRCCPATPRIGGAFWRKGRYDRTRQSRTRTNRFCPISSVEGSPPTPEKLSIYLFEADQILEETNIKSGWWTRDDRPIRCLI
jgi:hypothetical protein